MEGQKEYKVYKITNRITNDCYIGVTSISLKERLRMHKQKSRYNMPGKLFDAMRKYGIDNFTIELLEIFNNLSNGQDAEAKYIKKFDAKYNISPGGKFDCPTGVKELAKLMKDSVWRQEYLKRLKIGMLKSEYHNSPESKRRLHEGFKKWLREHPIEAYSIQRRATRIAAAKARLRPKKEKLSCNKMQLSRIKKINVKRIWGERTPEEKEMIFKKISETLKRRNAMKSIEQIQTDNKQLELARKNIDHKKRMVLQRIAVQKYWADKRANEN
jgi:group I intron endonuclease